MDFNGTNLTYTNVRGEEMNKYRGKILNTGLDKRFHLRGDI